MKNSFRQTRKRRLSRIAMSILVVFVFELSFPTVSWALTSGPGQPEFSSFEPVATTNMVNEFSGDFTYNLPVIDIPGPDGGGYSMSLSYHSGTSVEEEASWVGYGWTLNPGAINRQKRGIADDWNGEPVTYFNKGISSKTVTLGGSVGDLEIASNDLPISADVSMRYNNYKGFGMSAGIGMSMADGLATVGFQYSGGDVTFSASVNPGNLLSGGKEKRKKSRGRINELRDRGRKKRQKVYSKEMRKANKKASAIDAVSNIGYGNLNYFFSSAPSPSTQFEGSSYRMNVSFQGNPPPGVEAGISGTGFGSYSVQNNIPVVTRNAYGYMYSSSANQGDENSDMMDFSIERDTPYSKRDFRLPIPHSNPDTYSLTGEGLSGSFRNYHESLGTFGPASTASTTALIAGGLQIDVGGENGGGANISVGEQILTVDHWNGQGSSDHGNFSSAPRSFFRFNNDKGGYVRYDNNDEAERAGLNSDSYQSSIGKSFSDHNCASFIGYNFNHDFNKTDNSNNLIEAYTKEDLGNVDRTDGSAVGEFSIVSENGQNYTYGLPVYSGSEETVSIGLTDASQIQGFNGGLVYMNVANNLDESDYEVLVGEQTNAKYASTYLLTSITTTDYIDRTNNGPTEDDFGGYTKFNYEKITSNFKWRTPYQGMKYARNSFSNPKDDMANYSSGDKEIYYLKSVETKTHIAKFNLQDRSDGLEAASRSISASNGNISSSGLDKLKSLKDIVLYKKGINGQADREIKKVLFDYNYNLQQGLPNGENGVGKLTLNRMWMEYNGVKKAKIAPYQFVYQYPNSSLYDGLGEDLKYATFGNHISGLVNQESENPNYNQYKVDAWGNYQPDETRELKYRTWIDQNLEPNVDFDPAVYQLKQIILPSGGQIHVQYEQDEYNYVQNEIAHVMAKLSSHVENGPNDFHYTIDPADLGIYGVNIDEMVNQIEDYYINQGRRMYFKFLYNLKGFESPSLESCKSEYISGYLTVASVSKFNGKINIKPKQQLKNMPRKVCRDFVKTSRVGLLTSGNCQPGLDNDFFDDQSSPESIIQALMNNFTEFEPGNKCSSINDEFSYLRVPIFQGIRSNGQLKGKRGGGLRVKRILMYDDGLKTSQQKTLYGSEYFYLTKDNSGRYISSGVATNEPQSIREENPLITFMKRDGQALENRIVSGKNSKQLEGPVGEQLLPGPSVGYSKVIVKGIHSGKTHTGHSVKQFYTAKDYPILKNPNGLDNETEINVQNSFPIELPLPILQISNRVSRASQGFTFVLNNMHGQPRASYNYSSQFLYEDADEISLRTSLMFNDDNPAIFSSEEFEYFEYGEEIEVLSSPFGDPEPVEIGVEQNISLMSRSVDDRTTNINVEFDAGVGFAVIVFPWISFSPTMTSIKNKIHSHVSNKVVSYPPIVKSTTSYADGVRRKSVNKVFDKNTGQPIEIQTFDDFAASQGTFAPENFDHDGTYTTFNFPASHVYANMGQKVKSEGKTISVSNSDIVYSGNEEGSGMDLYQWSFDNSEASELCSGQLATGDLIQLSTGVSSTTQKDLFHIESFVDNTITLVKVSYSDYTADSWSDFNGSVRILRSGKSNDLGTLVGNLTIYGEYDTGVIAPTQAQEVQMANVIAALNQIDPQDITDPSDPTGSIISLDIQSALAGLGEDDLELFFEGECQDFPDDLFIKIENGQFNIYQEYQTLTSNIPCEELGPTVADKLNAYWEIMWNTVVKDMQGNYYCGNEEDHPMNFGSVDYSLHKWDGIEMDYEGGIIQSHADELIESLLDESLINSNCDDLFIGDYFNPYRPIERMRTIEDLFLLNQGVAKNRSVVINDINQNISLVTSLICSSVEEDEFYIAYGVVQDNNGSALAEEPIENYLDQLQIIPFFPNPNRGIFTSDDANCLAYIYPESVDGIQTNQIVQPLSEVYIAAQTCPSETLYELVCTNDLTNDGEYTITNTSHGEFGIEILEGNYELVYYPMGYSACPNSFIVVGCITFCEINKKIIENVVSSSFSTLDDKWDYNHNLYEDVSGEFANHNRFETGERGQWRQKSQFIYDVQRGLHSDYENPVSEIKNYNSGVYDMLLFDWNNPPVYGDWKKVNSINKYSPNGQVLEEKNILDVYSTAKFGYHKTIPYLVAQNSDYSSVMFESFENIYASGGSEFYFEDGYSYDSTRGIHSSNEAHTGDYSLRLIPNAQGLPLCNWFEESQLEEQTALVKLWLKSDREDRENIASSLELVINDDDSPASESENFTFVARSGEWALYEASLAAGLIINGTLSLKYNFSYPEENCYIDDIRVQPKNSSMITYVYDPYFFRIKASFDDQNFALLYQYDNEGQLVRKSKETERGIKVVQETQYNTKEDIDAQ